MIGGYICKSVVIIRGSRVQWVVSCKKEGHFTLERQRVMDFLMGVFPLEVVILNIDVALYLNQSQATFLLPQLLTP